MSLQTPTVDVYQCTEARSRVKAHRIFDHSSLEWLESHNKDDGRVRPDVPEEDDQTETPLIAGTGQVSSSTTQSSLSSLSPSPWWVVLCLHAVRSKSRMRRKTLGRLLLLRPR